MSDYRRWFIPGGMFFFTVVTYDRRPILTTAQGRRFLKEAIHQTRRSKAFRLLATVLLPDHWHLVMCLPAGDMDYSTRIKRIKEQFTRSWLGAGLPESSVTVGQNRKGERGIWQPRFWEHSILDEQDLENCVDYIHWNPCKHQLVNRVCDWPWSSFHSFVAAGHYPPSWGACEPNASRCSRSWGE